MMRDDRRLKYPKKKDDRRFFLSVREEEMHDSVVPIISII